MVKVSDLEETFNGEPIKVESKTYGIMELSELLLKDELWLDETTTKQLSAREFTVQIIFSHLLSPSLDIQDIHNLPDDELSLIGVQWLNAQQNGNKLSDGASFEVFRDVVYENHELFTEEARKQIDGIFTSQMHFISKMALPSLRSLSSSLNTNAVFALSQLANNIIVPQYPIAQVLSSSLSNLSTSLQPTVLELGALFQKVSASTQLITDTYNNLLISLPQLNLASILNTSQFFAGLPDLTELDKVWKEAKEGGEVFKKAGFGFITSDYVSFRTVRRFATISPKVRSAVVTNQLAAQTRNPQFEHKLKQNFQESSVLRRRWHIVEQAIKAHRRREYNIAVPALLAQIEGLIGDALILKGLVVSQGHKLYAKGPDGKPQPDKKGNPIEVRGVGTLIQRSTWQTHPALQGVAELISTQLAVERNHILHGRKTNYGSAKLTVQGLLLLFVISAEVVVFETGQIP